MLAGVVTQVVATSAGSRSPVNDDSWHTVFLRREAGAFQLKVDDRQAAPVTGRLFNVLSLGRIAVLRT